MTAARAKTEHPPVEEPPPAPNAREAFDPRELPTRTMGGRGEYMDVRWRLVWLRREHPDAIIETEQLGHEPGKWATFKATVTIPGDSMTTPGFVPNRGRATGHGSETASDFGEYYEKAETKAIGRALGALGYGTQFLPDDGESLADTPVDAPGATNAPTPIDDRRRQTQPAKNDHERENRRFHAVGASHGWSDAALHLIALSEFPKQQDGTATTSRAQLPAADLGWLADLLEKTIGRIVDPEGEIMPTPEVEYANAIARADLPTLTEIGMALKEAGISKKWLQLMWKTREHELRVTHGGVS